MLGSSVISTRCAAAILASDNNATAANVRKGIDIVDIPGGKEFGGETAYA
jgi:predicted membrane GTPase involved in stress response